MKIQFLSDLHLEVPKNVRYFKENKIKSCGDLLIIAGDTMCWDENTLKNPFWDDLASAFAQVLVIAGNHEFYKGYDIVSVQSCLQGAIRENINWYYNKSVVIDGVQIILSTLWSHISSDISDRIRSYVNDFSCIQYAGQLLTIDQYNEENRSCIDFITGELQKDYSKRIVVTHHAPILEAINENVRNSWFATLYANSLNELIRANNNYYCIYGNSHSGMQAFNHHDTTLVTNPCGYLSKKENLSFDPNMIITV